VIRPTYILLLVAILLAAVILVFATGPQTEVTPQTDESVEELAPKITAAELEEVVLPLAGSGPLQIQLEYLGDANYQSPVYAGNLSGNVIDAYGKPLSFARIEVVGGPQDQAFAIADKNGAYVLNGLLPGTHIFRINSGISAEIVRMQYVSRETKRDWLIGQSLSIKFEIRDSKNKVLAGAKVRSDLGLREAITDEQGIALLHGVPSGGRVVIDILAKGHVATRHELNLFAANTSEVIKLTALEQGGRLAGRVKSWPGGDMPTISIVPRTDASRSGLSVWEKFQDVAVDSSGYFSFDDLPTNQLLDVRVNHAQGVCDPRGRAVTAGKQSPTRCDFLVRLSKAKVSGRVLDESGNPVAGAEVELLAAEPLKVLSAIYPSIGSERLSARLPVPSQLRRTTRTNKSGAFSIALGDHIQGTGGLLLNVNKRGLVSAQQVIKKVGSMIEMRLRTQRGGASLEFTRRLDGVLPLCEWTSLPEQATTHGATADHLLEGYYRVLIVRDGKTILREDKYWISEYTKIVL
jgi:hypothetical protein